MAMLACPEWSARRFGWPGTVGEFVGADEPEAFAVGPGLGEPLALAWGLGPTPLMTTVPTPTPSTQAARMIPPVHSLRRRRDPASATSARASQFGSAGDGAKGCGAAPNGDCWNCGDCWKAGCWNWGGCW
jgi:hypothetical protein